MSMKDKILPMIRFIKLEAEEKASEIRQKAEEDFNTERANLVTEGKIKIAKEFDKKRTDFEVQKRIAYCNAVNTNRLKVLEAKDRILQDVLRDVVPRLVHLSSSPQYKTLLLDLLVESLLVLEEKNVVVQVREVDVRLMEEIIPEGQKLFEAKMGKPCGVTISHSRLPPPPKPGSEGVYCCGGLIATNTDGKITLNNTLDERLALVSSGMLPVVRRVLFGSKKRESEPLVEVVG